MSNLFDYVKSLLPKFGKDKVSELVRQTQSELTSYVIPSYREAENSLSRRKFVSPKVDAFHQTLKRNIHVKDGDNIVTALRKALEQVLKNNQIIEIHIGETFEDEVVVAGITVLKVNLLQLIETTSFISRYATKFLNYVYIVEKASLSNDDNYILSQLSKGEVEWLEKRYLDFCFSLSILTKSEKEVLAAIASIPDVSISENSAAINSVLGNKADPLGLKRLSGFTNNPIMHVRLLVAQYQANRYKEQKETNTILKLRLIDLRNTFDKTPSAKVEQEIEYMQRRIDKLSNEIREAEQSVE